MASASQGAPVYHLQQRMANATGQQQQQQEDGLQSPGEVIEANIYASYAGNHNNNNNTAPPSSHAHSLYGGMDNSSYSQRQRSASGGGGGGVAVPPQQPPPSGGLPPIPQQPPLMYPSSQHQQTQYTNSNSNSRIQYLARDDSVDVPDSLHGYGDDNASMHSRAHLNPKHQQQQQQQQGGQPLMAHFRSDQMSPPAGSLGGGGITSKGAQALQERFNEKNATNIANGSNSAIEQEKQQSQRQLPEGYKTPPAFSRAPSSGWGTIPSKNNKNKNNNNNNTGASSSNNNSPYGSTLGGLASKSDPALQFAEGDYANNRFARFWLAILARNVVIRWLCFIVPVLVLLWIPGICAVTIDPTPRVWGVSLMNWSIWLTIAWLSWWGGMLVAMIGPHILRHTIGAVAPELRHFIDYLFALKKSLAAFLWTLTMWIAFQPLINSQGPNDKGTGAGLTLSQITKFLFAIFICSIILVVEKLLIQVIAYNFHRTSYADRISENKFAVRSLVVLYLNSRDIGRTDTLDGNPMLKDKARPSQFLKKGLKSARKVVTGASTALGTVASEIVGERVLQSNSPQSMVTAALSSGSKSRQLARRIFFSFTPSSQHVMLKENIAPFFPNKVHLDMVYAIFDKDENGDVSLEEIEMACLDIHRERQSLASSMRDLDSAVARLDQIFMSLWYILSVLIIIGIVSISFSAFVTSGATFVLGLSWLIGGTSQEVLSAVVFLLAKHPYDVGDLIAIDGMDGGYVVKEIALLSTVFKKTDGNVTQIPHTVLNTKAIQNYRRSGPTSESVTWDVDFSTDFEAIEALRQRMLEFVEHERRDYLPNCDITVDSFSDQSKLTLKSSIPYKTNWSNSALKAQRRNKWICALKIAMAQLQIFGPGGAGNPSPEPAGPQEIKIINAEAAPAYRSTTSGEPSPDRPDASGTAARTVSPTPQPQLPRQQSLRSIAEEVNRLHLLSRENAIQDEQTDIFDYQGQGNRQDSLDAAEVQHAAQVQVEGHSTAVDARPSAEGAALNRFRQQDLELGRVRQGRQ